MSIREFLHGQPYWFQMMLHRPAPGASQVAASLRVPGRRVAKAVMVRAGDQYVLAVLPATARVELDRLTEILDESEVELASEDEVARIFDDCERGPIPPFGSLYGLKTIVDESLASSVEIICAGNVRHEGVRMRYRDFEAIEQPRRARFAITPSPDHSRRRAG